MQQALQNTNTSSSTATLAQKGHLYAALYVSHQKTNSCIVDSGVLDHMTGDINVFSKYIPCQDGFFVRIADGTTFKVVGKGSLVISKDITLDLVLHVPKLGCSLLSIYKLTKNLGCVAKFLPHFCELQDMNSGKMTGNVEESTDLYFLRIEDQNKRSYKVALMRSSKNDNDVMLWHYRLGHPNFMYLKKMFSSLFNKDSGSFKCEVCELAKHTKSHYFIQPYKPSNPFTLIQRVSNVTGSRWFVTFIDDHIRVTWVFLMKEKSEVGSIFENFHKMVQTQFQSNIQVLRTDNGGEYFHHTLGSYVTKNDIIHQTSCSYSPQHNGTAERKNKHL